MSKKDAPAIPAVMMLVSLTRWALMRSAPEWREAGFTYLRYGHVSRPIVIGFDPAEVPSGESRLFVVKLQELFKGLVLEVPAGIAANFSIEDIRVGRDSALISNDPIPATRFVGGHAFELDTAQIFQTITIAVRNKSGAKLLFECSYSGLTQ